MSDGSARLMDNLAQVRGRISRAAERCGRDPAGVRLIAVSKGQDARAVRQLIAAGVEDFGENRVQELTQKAGAIASEGGQPTWHMIGGLQTNKVKALLRACHIVHSVDRLALASELSRRASELPGQALVKVFLEVNVSGESTKSGVIPGDAEGLLRQIVGLPGLEVVGLMTMAPASGDPESSRPVFRGLRLLADRLNGLGAAGVHLTELSMGMSQDFEVAIEEGATLVRVGTAIFGTRTRV